jgi:hypothetical protein
MKRSMTARIISAGARKSSYRGNNNIAPLSTRQQGVLYVPSIYKYKFYNAKSTGQLLKIRRLKYRGRKDLKEYSGGK